MRERVLVIGASGFLGKAVCVRLSELGYRLTGLSRSPKPENLGNVELDWVQADAADLKAVARTCHGQSAVIYLASGASPARADTEPYMDFTSGPALALVALEACRMQSVNRFIFASSGGTIYGKASEVPTNENYQPRPEGIYGLGKLTIEHYMELFQKLYGMKCVSLRIANPFGPGQKMAGGQGVIAYALNSAMSGEPFNIFGDGEHIRDFVYITDVANAFHECLKYDGNVPAFNVGSGVGVSINAVIKMIDRCLGGSGLQINRLPPRAVDVPVSLLDTRLILAETGWRPLVNIEDGLKATVEYVRGGTRRPDR
ncbi:NAD-dependent epimerase/dehydratase family protein [Rhizobium sp. DKSPLA3]|uniref:NAD-dependent epimerase/dehydratase family protein n=1 Tax=Rhizobium quercicola TaxID=2901226 RepID=A0A9X1NRI6_9HYPH|nr:NAD-dependent epimerase/dehydratase family protein [Rhizobium quercicola]MCD7109680.1 NAD-dependent epimerase/dehydratase family protein [Rhizobium quercicola]